MQVLLLFVALGAAPLTLQLKDDAEAALRLPQIHVADVADAAGGTASERRLVGARVIARMPSDRRQIAITRGALAQLLHRTTGLTVAGSTAGRLQLRMLRPAAGPARAACWRASSLIGAGSAIDRDSIEEADCTATSVSALVRFDRAARAARAVEDIPAGTPLGRMAPPVAPVETGAELTLTSAAGPVTVVRPVRALQPGRDGRRMFVQDADGQVLSVSVRQTQGDRP